MATAKNPAKAQAGLKGARARWGPPRLIRLDDLTAEQARLVMALVNAAKEAAGSAMPTAPEDRDVTSHPHRTAA